MELEFLFLSGWSRLAEYFLGILLGGISGYYGGWSDLVIQRLIEILQSLLPPHLMALTVLAQGLTVEQTYFAITLILSSWAGQHLGGRFVVGFCH